MDKRELQELLSQSYKQENWKKIVSFVFPNVSILSTPKEFPISNDKIKSFRQLGNVRLNDGKNLALFELLLSDTVNIQRNRVELNNEISKYIDQEQIHGVLSVFEQGTEDYRFTFSARSTEFDEEESDFVQRKTDTKRYTYVLGKNESCKTPAERFFELSEKKSGVDINAIQNAFSVEQLSKEFFDKYKKQFEKFWKYIDSKKEYRKIIFGTDREKGIRDFTKKLLGRIVFLHFLQKKGWMGCTAGIEEWQDGDKQFMQTLFDNYSKQSEFHSKCLAELFYNTLNKKRADDLYACDGLTGDLSQSKVPYLNGGLFDSDEDISRKIDFPASYFQELFDFFGQYNFTIDENDPNDHEVGIDPEMLGHIFENLLEDNKDKGAFYTPKVIVQYMCQESVIEYINTKINHSGSPSIKSAIEDLIRNKLAEKCSDLELVQAISKALFEVKICDPAIGSGAFPMGILNVIYSAIEELYFIQPDSVATIWNISDTEWQPHLVKKNIIQHSIYGVDLESGAVDIARLRFWLALVVDEIEPLPLPNLDYKIMQGNSLLESFEGIDLSKISDASAYEEEFVTDQIDIFSGEAKKKASLSMNFDDIKSLMDEYFNTNEPEEKKDIHNRIDYQVINHIRYTLNQHKNELISNKNILEKNPKSHSDKKIINKLKSIQDELSTFQSKEIKLAKLTNSNERPFFLWNLFFKEVFDDGGFDIVIGNPPYIGERKNKKVFVEVQNGANGKYYLGRMDYYYFFYHLSIDLLKEKGCASYITTNYFPTAMGARKLRQDLKKRTDIIKVINFNEGKVFDSAFGQHNLILLFKKLKSDRLCTTKTVTFSGFLNDIKLTKILLTDNNDDFKYCTENNQSNIWDGEEDYLRLEGVKSTIENNSLINKVLNKILLKSNDTLGMACKPLIGLESSLDSVFVLNKSQVNSIIKEDREKELFKPFYKNSNVHRYKTESKTNKYILYLHEKIEKIESYKGVWEYLKKHEDSIKSRKGANLKGAFKRGNWWVLNTPRLDMNFKEEKIVTPYRSKSLRFAISDDEWYASRDVYYIIKNKDNINLKFIIGLLNSNLYYQWYFNRGKRKGDTLELYAKPLNETPIYIPDNSFQIEIINCVKLLTEFYKNNDVDNITPMENKLNKLVYKLYEIDYNEIREFDLKFCLDVSEQEYLNF